jgi:hypothetical protein
MSFLSDLLQSGLSLAGKRAFELSGIAQAKDRS